LLIEIEAAQHPHTHGPVQVPEQIKKGVQHDTLFRMGSSMRAKGFGEAEIFAALWEANKARCEEPGPEENIRKLAASICAQYPPGESNHRSTEAAPTDAEVPPVGPRSWQTNANRQRAEPKEITYRELIERKPEVGQMLFEGYPLPAHGATLKFGPSRGGKTILAAQELLAVASGRALFDYYRVLKKGPVMVVEMDDPAGADAIAPIVTHFAARFQTNGELPFHTFDQLSFGFGPQMLDWLRERIAEWQLVLTVLDSYTALRGSHGPGIDIVKAEQTELRQLDELGKELKSAIEVIHHDSTGKAARGLEWTQGAAGTFAMGMATEAQIHVSRFADLDIAAPERLVRMRARHSADLHLVLRFREKTEDYEHVLESGAAALYPLMKQIQAEFGDVPFGVGDLTQAIGVSRATAHRWLDRLRFAGVLQKTQHQYKLAVKL
jgi:hypothetical protein